MPLPILAAAATPGVLKGVGKVLKGVGKVAKKIGGGLKKIFGGNSKKRQAKKAAAQAVKAEQKIEKLNSKIAKQQGKISGAVATKTKAGGILSGLFGGSQSSGSVDVDPSFTGIPAIAPVDDALGAIQNTVFPMPGKQAQPEYTPYELVADEGIQPLSRGDYDVDAAFVNRSGKKKKGVPVWVWIGGVLFLMFFGWLIISVSRKR